jgi:hypothetical protein
VRITYTTAHRNRAPARLAKTKQVKDLTNWPQDDTVCQHPDFSEKGERFTNGLERDEDGTRDCPKGPSVITEVLAARVSAQTTNRDFGDLQPATTSF